jgi:hypothetical protein
MGRPKKKTQVDPTDILPREILSSRVPDFWRYIINELLSYNSNFLKRKFTELNNEASFKLLMLRVRSWEIALHWLIKKEWDTKHKILAKKSIVNGYEAKGELLRAIFLLCERCHSYGEVTSKISTEYPNAAHWFGKIFAEFIWHEFKTINNIGSEKKGAKKKQILFERREFIRKHGSLDNPKNPLNNNTAMQATYKLLECSCLLAKQSDVFRDRQWKGYIDALKNEVQSLDTPEFSRIFFEGEGDEKKLYMQNSQGRGRLLIN